MPDPISDVRYPISDVPNLQRRRSRGTSKSRESCLRLRRDPHVRRFGESFPVATSYMHRISGIGYRFSDIETASDPLREVLEARVLLDERELHRPDGAVALFAHDDLGGALGLLVRLAVGVAVLLLTVDEHHDVRVLLERARLAPVRELRAVIRARLGRARELRQRDDRDLQLLGEPLQRSRDRGELRLTALETAAPLHQLDVVDDEQVQAVLGLKAARLRAHLEDA